MKFNEVVKYKGNAVNGRTVKYKSPLTMDIKNKDGVSLGFMNNPEWYKISTFIVFKDKFFPHGAFVSLRRNTTQERLEMVHGY